MSYGTNSSSFYRPPQETKRTPTYEELFGVPKSAEHIAYDEQKEREARISAKEASERRRKEDKKEREAYFAEQERIKYGRLADKGKEIVGTYRNSYDADDLFKLGAVNSIETAKAVADETYMQYWYDKANDIVGKWSTADWAAIAEPRYEDVKVITDSRRGSSEIRQRRVLPEGYEELQEINSYIEKGPLDFSTKETHKMLINPAGRRGYGKYQTWISPNNPLRQAVEAQADVMTKYLDREGIPIVTEFEDGNPDNIYGEGAYLNTGTAAHINWDSELKRMQRYMTTPDSEVGTYSQVFYRPEADSILDHWMVDIMATITGNTVPLSIIRQDDPEDILKSAVLKEVIPADTLENTLASANITNETVNDLFGANIGSTAWSEGLANVTTTGLEGGDLGDALLSEFGRDLAEPVVGGALDAIPNIDIPNAVTELVQNIETIAQPVIDAVKTTTEAVENVIDTAIIDPIDELTQALISDDVSLDDAVPPVETVAKPEETTVEPSVEPEETVAETKEEIPVEPEDTTIVEKAASKVGFGAETLSNILDVPTDEVTKVFEDTTDALFTGESGKDALLEGLGGSALEELGEGAENLLGGAVDFIETILPLDPLEDVVGAGVELADAVIGAVGDSELVNAIEEGGKALGDLGQSAIDAVVDSDIVQAVGEAGQTIIDTGSDVLSNVEDVVSDIASEGEDIIKSITDPAGELGQQAIDAISDVTSEVEDVVSDVASEAEDVVKAVTDPIGEVGQDVIDTISDVTSDAEDVISDVTSEVEDVILDVYEQVTDIDLPEVDIDLPEVDIDLPEVDIDLPEVDIPTPSFDPRLLAGLMAMPQQQQATQVEGLFDKELFKFDTEIKSTQEMLSPFMNLRRYG